MHPKIFEYVMYVGKHKKAYTGYHSFYLLIFLTFSDKFVLIEIEWKTVNSAKSKIKVSFKKKKKKRKENKYKP